MSWADNHDASLEKLKQVQGSLTVGLIMVHRDVFMTCRPFETASEVKARNVNEYSFIPVKDERDRIIGLYDAHRWFEADAPATPVSEDYLPLSEDLVIGADASIFDFIMQADKQPTNLVISGNQVGGLVSLSDMQLLPVRVALFALVTSLEMAMALAVERFWPDPDGWLSKISAKRREKIEADIEAAKKAGGFVSEIAFTQISDKASILRKGKVFTNSSSRLKSQFNEIRDLRDSLAHANRYADTPSNAERVCGTVRSIYELKEELLKALEGAAPRESRA
ncbi:hypothetical protein [Maricaulis salignorans]|uniref:hypothetical protein n=1 Tax=Maricaulis salignorans TaxID=144026 RepID=UPI003A954098